VHHRDHRQDPGVDESAEGGRGEHVGRLLDVVDEGFRVGESTEVGSEGGVMASTTTARMASSRLMRSS
jgi:hypothetical protein